MSIGLIVVIVLLSWALGPAILRWAGGFLALATLLLWAFPLGTHTPPMALLVTGIGGALLWCAGMSWQDARETGRAR
jgi:hypothetical protein